MKFKNVKVSQKDLEAIRKFLGVNVGILNIERGVFRVSSDEDVMALSEKFDIENVDWKSFGDFKKELDSKKQNVSDGNSGVSEKVSEGEAPECDKEVDKTKAEHDKKKPGEYTLEERNQIIGTKIKKGSIVRAKLSDETIHIIISKISEQGFQGYKIVLGTDGYDSKSRVLLRKGEDVVYRNLTYKALVQVTRELITGLTKKDFVYGRAGLIVGKVINQKKLQEILNQEESKEVLAKTSELGPVCDDQVLSKEKKEVENASPKKFEEHLSQIDSLDEFLSQTGLIGTVLEKAIRICVENKSSNMKKLLPLLQKSLPKCKSTQNALKNQMNDEFSIWREKTGYLVNGDAVTGFLKAIVKRFKN